MLHRSPHCGEILWPQRGRLGELDLPVGAGNEHPVDYPAVELDMCIQRAADALHETHPQAARAHTSERVRRRILRRCRLAHGNKIPLILPIV